jgi:hypothetical protein
LKAWKIYPGARGTLTVYRPDGIHCSPIRTSEIHIIRDRSWKLNGTVEDGKYYEFQYTQDQTKRLLVVQADYIKAIEEAS